MSPAQARLSSGLYPVCPWQPPGATDTAQPLEEPELLPPQLGPVASSPCSSPWVRALCWAQVTGRSGDTARAAISERKGVNRTFCLFPPAPPPPFSLPALYHCRSRGAGGVEGRRGFLRRPGLPAAAGPRSVEAAVGGARGRCASGARCVRAPARVPACLLPASCPCACLPPARVPACGWERGWGEARGRRAGKAGGRACLRAAARQGCGMAVGSVKMPSPCEGAELARSWTSGGGAHEPPPVQLRQKLRELPALLRSGLTLRRKSAAAAGRTLSRRISNPYLETPSNKIYGESSSCAGRALRNIFTLQASDLIKDRVYLTGICRRSCVGSELVDWLLEQCPFVKCRSTAVGVWQLLLDMGIILSVDRQVYFQDTHAFYQFSADECTYLFCEFEKEEGWKNGVKLLLQLLPLSPPRIDMCNLPDQKIEDTAETNAEILARLTSAVQRELAAVIALKARKSAIHQNEEHSSQEIRGLEELKDTSDAQAGVLCKLQGRDDIGRIELVQKLARENCQFLQTDRKPPEKAEQADDGGGGERAREEAGAALVLRKVWSRSPAPERRGR
ncbi:hypothetical protein Q9233_015931 [Columba guinea]|nr:hypothetical protein Q9233_015931 [Columba guinea]